MRSVFRWLFVGDTRITSTQMFKRKSKNVAKEISVISVSHGLHVDENFEWSGPEAASQFVFGEKLGEGSFGAVYRASHKTAGTDFAIKIIPTQENDELGDIEHEIEILKVSSLCSQHRVHFVFFR